MATIKSYTDIEQSKKLAEVLPIESADMYYQYVLPKSDKIKHNPEIGNPINVLKWYNRGYITSGKEPVTLDEYCIPCWSLAALLGFIPNYKLSSEHNYHTCTAETSFGEETVGWFDSPVDACYEMILKLKKLKLLFAK